MSALSNIIGKARRLPEAAVELWSRFWEADEDAIINDLRYEREKLRDLVAKLQTHDIYLSGEIRRRESRRYLGIGS